MPLLTNEKSRGKFINVVSAAPRETDKSSGFLDKYPVSLIKSKILSKPKLKNILKRH